MGVLGVMALLLADCRTTEGARNVVYALPPFQHPLGP